MMNWPSMMSLEPPPVTPSRKFPPRLGAPAAPVAEPVLGDEELEPHAAARPPTAAKPAAPTRSCLRETSVMSCPSCPSALALCPGRPGFLPMRVPDDVLPAAGTDMSPRAGIRPCRGYACIQWFCGILRLRPKCAPDRAPGHAGHGTARQFCWHHGSQYEQCVHYVISASLEITARQCQ